MSFSWVWIVVLTLASRAAPRSPEAASELENFLGDNGMKFVTFICPGATDQSCRDTNQERKAIRSLTD